MSMIDFLEITFWIAFFAVIILIGLAIYLIISQMENFCDDNEEDEKQKHNQYKLNSKTKD